jgi:AcrR family transcriptional regulator
MKKRKYQQNQRALQQQETRERIVDAAVALHEEIGPVATTISALADRAGVQRLTVYRHFPSDEALFGACSSKWFGQHPPPDTSAIASGEPRQRTRDVLLALYRYYEGTQKMWMSVYRDAARAPAVADALGGFEQYLASVQTQLLADWSPRRAKPLRVTLAHALRFSTWQSLTRQGLGSPAIADLVSSWVRAAAVP